MIKTRICLLVLISLSLITCKRDFVPPILQCDRYHTEDDFRKCGFISFDLANQVESPTFNPNNADEFAYVDANRNLVKYNMATKEKETLVDNLDRILTPDWGAGGWIVFSAGWKIWRFIIKKNYYPQFGSQRHSQLPTECVSQISSEPTEVSLFPLVAPLDKPIGSPQNKLKSS